MPDPFTIRIFVPDGDPDSVRIIDRMNWTGLGIAFPRDKWSSIKHRSEFNKTGVYILVGYGDAPSGAIQGLRYTSFEKLKAAKALVDLIHLGKACT